MKANPTPGSQNPSAAAGTTTTTSVVGSAVALKQAADDAKYAVEPKALQDLRESTPWMKDPKFFKRVALSPSAIMKILMHCQSGVEKGIAKGSDGATGTGNPIEVMGMLLGRPDPVNPDCFVITDAFPLPIEGFETRVVADDEQVVNHMIALGEALETTRRERFCGWYHSHPFDLSENSHCFLSQTDLTTQLQWQRLEDPHGNPFVAIVVDPLRSAHQQSPEIKAFRAYPPEYNPPVPNECPDGSQEPSEQIRLEKWGSCWNRYYELSIEYFMSSVSRRVLERLTQDYLWMRTLTRPPPRTPALLQASQQYQTAAAVNSGGGGGPGARSAMGGGEAVTAAAAGMTADALVLGSASALGPVSERTKELHKAVQTLADTAADQLCDETLQRAKEQIFT